MIVFIEKKIKKKKGKTKKMFWKCQMTSVLFAVINDDDGKRNFFFSFSFSFFLKIEKTEEWNSICIFFPLFFSYELITVTSTSMYTYLIQNSQYYAIYLKKIIKTSSVPLGIYISGKQKKWKWRIKFAVTLTTS